MTFDAHALFCEVIRVYDGTKIRASCGGTNCSYNGCRAIQRAFAGLAARSPAPATGDAGAPRVPPRLPRDWPTGGFLLDEKDRYKAPEPRTAGKDFCAECDCQSAAGRGCHMVYAGGWNTGVVTCAFCPHTSSPVELARAFHVVRSSEPAPRTTEAPASRGKP